ncbi:hypothetical protein K4V08_03980 [Staphylococcus epidermidis]|jgi:bacteriophage protein of unknown function (DUF646)|uniref:hypothetical protein n=2 Tax=cellular organisms TaxID=131567 RepID=UPI000DF9DAF8|nr:hypothetical protein [Staphylococcus epidermidis]MUX42292.1 hypothetical protein [Shigella flexneri]KAB2177179.1 hypothetical protein F9B30_01895 [Staphylococcus epidermidis]MBM0863356.1 hypothetical protein [Staphylococcus epidermidis]MBM5874019.1 hypothetical protein [Staphylococcus epidermidis]MBM5967834.1 hypothetical protein [Staphylococcus epidermidis]
MTMTLKGDKEIIAYLETKYGKSAMKRITDFALTKAGNKVVSIIKGNMKSFEDTGESVEETTLSKPMTIKGVRTVKIHWRGPKQRYRIIHLNEYGHYDRSGKWINTAGKGVIENAMREGRETYFRTVKEEMRKRV